VQREERREERGECKVQREERKDGKKEEERMSGQ
jgi:hypothetical protein